MAPKQMAIPQPFSYLLPGQGLVAGVTIYSTIYVFGVGKIPFILAVVAAGLHFLLGVYFCFIKNRLRTHDLYLVPVVLVAGAGVWAGSLYYFAKLLDVILRIGQVVTAGGQPETATWVKVGTSMTGLNVLLDIILLIVFIVAATKKTSPYPPQEPVYNPPTAPAHAPTFPVAPATVQYQQPQQQYQQQQYYQVASVPIIQQQQQQPAAPQRIVSSTSSDFKTPIASTISPTTSPSPSQQYQQYQQPQTVQYQHQRQQSFTSQQQQQQTPSTYSPIYQHQQQPERPYVYSPSPQPPPTPPQPKFQSPSQTNSTSGSKNRITTLRRLSALQSPAGNWVYSTELASLLELWSSERDSSTNTSGITPNTPSYEVTRQTQILMTNLREYIYSAQREGRVQSALSSEELTSLQAVNWDLGWVGMGIERAGVWLNNQGQRQGQTYAQQGGGGGYAQAQGQAQGGGYTQGLGGGYGYGYAR